MLVSREPDPLIELALALAEAADQESERFPQVRVGIAYGEAIGRAGDWFGRPVNLASRITGIARPGTVLTDEALKEAAGAGVALVVRRQAQDQRSERGARALPSACSRLIRDAYRGTRPRRLRRRRP